MAKIRIKIMLHLYAIPILLFFFNICYRVKIWGKKHVPAKGCDDKGIIVMSNHRSHLDPFLIGVSAFPRFYKPFFYPADAKLWKLPLFRPILHGMNCFPVFKGSKSMDIIKYHIVVIKRGGSVCYFPEGARTKDGKLQPGKLGAGLIAHSTKALVIPCAVKNTEIAMPVGKPFTLGGGSRRITLKVKFGPPLDLRRYYKLPSSKETSQKISDLIMVEIAKLLDTM
ncbi:MAG: 1-acyl-sn-glycerol-3-phosphate acyltransferase [Candidatus Heimdallarchaeota archaeon]|nr:MAG: 1-acyl-sn-glycerol-3-phosphate acyltransferase [Candidatus Heimdallarchaeota archaeon]